MVRNATLIALSVVAIGFGVPAVCVYSSVYYGFNFVVAGIIASFAIFWGSVLGIVGIAEGPLGRHYEESKGLSAAEREKLNAMRAHQRATLEQLDDITAVLKEIRDLLKATAE